MIVLHEETKNGISLKVISQSSSLRYADLCAKLNAHVVFSIVDNRCDTADYTCSNCPFSATHEYICDITTLEKYSSFNLNNAKDQYPEYFI